MLIRDIRRIQDHTIRVFLYALAANLIVGCGSGGENKDTVPVLDDPILDESGLQNISYPDLRAGELSGIYSELQVALTEFSLLFEPIDGAIEDIVAGQEPMSVTHTLATLHRLREELSSEQTAIIDGAISSLINRSTLVYSTQTVSSALGGAANTNKLRQTRNADRPECDFTRLTSSTPGNERLCSAAGAANLFITDELGGESFSFGFRVRVNSNAEFLGATIIESDGTCEIIINNSEYTDVLSIDSIVAGQMFHCWHWKNYPESYYRSPGWVMAGLAEWFGAWFAGDNPASRDIASLHTRTPRYRLFSETSTAIGFFWQIDHLLGPGEQVWVLINDLVQQTSSDSAFALATEAIPESDLVSLAISPTFQPERGPLWTFDAPISALIIRQPSTSGDALVGGWSAAPGEQVLETVEWNLSEPAWINIQTLGTVLQRWDSGSDIISTEPTETRWCSEGACECEDGSQLFPDASPVPEEDTYLTLGIVGGASSSSEVSWGVMDVAELCNDEDDDNTSSTEIPSSDLVGTWRANPEAVAAAYELTFDNTIEVAGVTGDVLLILRPNGTATLQYNDVKILINNDVVQSVSMVGSGTLDWGLRLGSLIFSNTSDFSFTSTTNTFIGGQLEGFTVSLNDLDLSGSSTSTFSLNNNTLTIHNIAGSEGDIIFPLVWTRQ